MPTSIAINHRALIMQPASTKSFPHTPSNQNRNAAIHSIRTNPSLKQKQILTQDALHSQSVSITEAFSIHCFGVLRVSAIQKSSVQASSTATPVTRQPHFLDLPCLENHSSSSYLIKWRLSSPFIKSVQDFAWPCNRVCAEMLTWAPAFLIYLEGREVLNHSSNLGIYFMKQHLPSQFCGCVDNRCTRGERQLRNKSKIKKKSSQVFSPCHAPNICAFLGCLYPAVKAGHVHTRHSQRLSQFP